MHMLYSYLVLFVTEPAKELTIIWCVISVHLLHLSDFLGVLQCVISK